MKCVIAIIDEWTDTHGFMYVAASDYPDSGFTTHEKWARRFTNKSEAEAYIRESLASCDLPTRIFEVKDD